MKAPHLTPDRAMLVLLAAEAILFAVGYLSILANAAALLLALLLFCLIFMVLIGWGATAVVGRRQFQFGIRSMLIFMLVCSLVFGWIAMTVKAARKHHQVVLSLQQAGAVLWHEDVDDRREPPTSDCDGLLGMAGFTDFDLFSVVTDLSFVPVERETFGTITNTGSQILIDDESAINPHELATRLAILKGLRRVRLAGLKVNDECLTSLCALHDLELLDVRCTCVTAAGVEKFQKLRPKVCMFWGWDGACYFHGRHDDGTIHMRFRTRQTSGAKTSVEQEIESLDLSNQGAGWSYELARLKGWVKLQEIDLSKTNLDADGLARLKELKQLRRLDLHEVHFESFGETHEERVAQLMQLTQLRYLNLHRTYGLITDDDLQKLKKALPQCEIVK